MFTGIIAATGMVDMIETRGGDKRFVINTDTLDLSDLSQGDSISVSGVCLSIVDLEAHRFAADISSATLSDTTFNQYTPGTKVNLEKSMRLSDRVNGHLVSGHVDGTGTIEQKHPESRSTRFLVGFPVELKPYICRKGAIAIDGVSLTVNEVNAANFGVNIIPHTAQQTVFSDYRVGTQVNLEVDIIARYTESIMRQNLSIAGESW